MKTLRVLIYPSLHEIKSCDYLIIIYMQKFDSVLIGAATYLCVVSRVVGILPQESGSTLNFKKLSICDLSQLEFALHEDYHSRNVIPVFRTSCCVKSDIILFRSSSSYLLNIFAIAVFGSPCLTDI